MSASAAEQAVRRNSLGARLARVLVGVERAAENAVRRQLLRRPGWQLRVVPFVSHGTADAVHVRARVLLTREDHGQRVDPPPAVVAGLGYYLSVEVPGVPLTVDVAGVQADAVSGPEGYVEAKLSVRDLTPGWHPVTFRLVGEADGSAEGRLLVADPEARLGIVSDIDDTVIHTGLTRLVEAVRTTLLTPEDARVPMAGAAELYHGLVAADAGRAPIFYVSTGAWNLHPMLERFLTRHGFPAGPLLLTDWGPGSSWLFRETSVAVKTRVITDLLAEHPQLRWVLVGDSGQDDPEAYAAVATAQPDRVRAIYIRDVPPQSPHRARRVRRLADELAACGVPMLLVRDSLAVAEHAHGLGLLDADQRDHVRAAVSDQRPPPASRPVAAG